MRDVTERSGARLPLMALAALGLLHALFVGFVFSMIFGHAPIILPSVLGVPVLYRPALYGPLAVLHGSLALRVAARRPVLPA